MSTLQKTIIAPSLLSADFGYLADAVRDIEKAGGDWVHLDIMDGSFVPNITFGPRMVSCLRPHSKLPFDVHLMIVNPDKYIEDFARAGSDIITIHYESTIHIHRVMTEIKRLGKKAGISIVPSTPAETLEQLLLIADLVLIMTVNPGFGGQKLIEQTLTKVKTLKRLKEKNNYNYLIEVDGGINRETALNAVKAGAEVLVAGSAIFNSAKPAEEIRLLKKHINKTI